MLRTPDPYNGPTTEGIDVSFYQKRVDWPKVAAAHEHVKFAIARIGDGTGVDSTFRANYAGARAAGLIPGSYQFVRPLKDIEQQAEVMIRELRAVGFRPGVDLPPTIDVERGDDPDLGDERVVHDPKHVGDLMLRWAEYAERELGVRPMVYGGSFFAQAIHDDRLGAYPLWTPHYGVTVPGIPAQWAKRGAHWSIWQYDSSHGIDGIVGHAVDHNLFRGDAAALAAFCAASAI